MIDAADYTISVQRGDFDGDICFEARVRELPHLAEYADSYEEAYALAIDSIETTSEILAEKGKQMPPPQVSAMDYSGRVTLRLPRTLHRELSNHAVEEGVSLNQHIVDSLSFNAGYSKGIKSAPQNVWVTIHQEDDPHMTNGQPPNIRSVPLYAVA